MKGILRKTKGIKEPLEQRHCKNLGCVGLNPFKCLTGFCRHEGDHLGDGHLRRCVKLGAGRRRRHPSQAPAPYEKNLLQGNGGPVSLPSRTTRNRLRRKSPNFWRLRKSTPIFYARKETSLL